MKPFTAIVVLCSIIAISHAYPVILSISPNYISLAGGRFTIYGTDFDQFLTYNLVSVYDNLNLYPTVYVSPTEMWVSVDERGVSAYRASWRYINFWYGYDPSLPFFSLMDVLYVQDYPQYQALYTGNSYTRYWRDACNLNPVFNIFAYNLPNECNHYRYMEFKYACDETNAVTRYPAFVFSDCTSTSVTITVPQILPRYAPPACTDTNIGWFDVYLAWGGFGPSYSVCFDCQVTCRTSPGCSGSGTNYCSGFPNSRKDHHLSGTTSRSRSNYTKKTSQQEYGHASTYVAQDGWPTTQDGEKIEYTPEVRDSGSYGASFQIYNNTLSGDAPPVDYQPELPPPSADSGMVTIHYAYHAGLDEALGFPTYPYNITIEELTAIVRPNP